MRSAARARFQGRSSSAWQTPQSPGGAPSPSPDAIDRPPSVMGFPMRAEPDQPEDTIGFESDGVPVGAITGIGDPNVGVQLGAVDEKAIDQLWDWVREDTEGVFNYLGFVPQHSRALFKWIENFSLLAAKGLAWHQAIYAAGELIGFVMLHPVSKTAHAITGDCHIYLAINARGNLDTLLPMLMAEADRLIPNVSLRVVTARDDEWARLLRGVGFTTQIVLTRPAASTGATSGT